MPTLPDQVQLGKVLGQVAADRAKNPIQVAIPVHPHPFMAEIPDMLAPGLQFDKMQVGRRVRHRFQRSRCAAICPPVSVGEADFMHIGHRGAFIQVDQDMRNVRQPYPRSPQQAVQRLVKHHALGHVQQHPVLRQGAGQAGKFSFLGLHDLAQDLFDQIWGYSVRR